MGAWAVRMVFDPASRASSVSEAAVKAKGVPGAV